MVIHELHGELAERLCLNYIIAGVRITRLNAIGLELWVD
jgi:hypothetical protein